MRWRRAVVFAAIVVAHFLLVWLFPSGNGPREPPEPDLSFATLVVPERIAEPAPRADHSRPAARATRASRSSQAKAGGPAASEPVIKQPPDTQPALIDWAQEAQISAANSLRSEASAVRPTTLPVTPRFSWDDAASHRFESSAQGLTVNLNDRCSLLISLYLMAIMGGCKIGQLPAHGDLFSHMQDGSALPGN